MKHIWDEDYPAVYAAGVSEGMRLAFETPVSDTDFIEHTRGRLCTCQGDEAVHRGFKAGWSSVRKVQAKQVLGKR